MRLNANVAANYASRLWSGFSTFVFVPLYLRLLGPESFGLVTFSMTLLGIAFILDMGMSNAFAREMARDRSRAHLAGLLRSLEIVYLGTILVILIAAVPGSRYLADHWLNASTLDADLVRRCIAFMLAASIVQVMMALYMGSLLGSNRHVEAAAFQIGFGLVRSGLVLPLLAIWPKVELVFIWQLGAAVLFLILVRRAAWRDLKHAGHRPRFSSGALRDISRFAAGMFGIALISTINTQSDKLVVSKVFTLAEFGAYSVASLVGQVPAMLALPLAVTILPRLTAHIERDERSDLIEAYMRYSMMIAIVASGAAAGIVATAPQLLTLILGQPPAPILVDTSRVLTVGGALLAAQYMPYHLAVACGHTRTNIVLGALSAAILPVAIWIGARTLGLIGAAWPWLFLNAAGAAMLALRITPRFLGPHLSEWTLRANAVPALCNIAVVVPAALLLDRASLGPTPIILLIGVACAIAMALNGAFLLRAFPTGRQTVSRVLPSEVRP